MVAFAEASWDSSALAKTPALIWVRICASWAITLEVVVATAAADRVSPSETAAARIAVTSAPIRVSVR